MVDRIWFNQTFGTAVSENDWKENKECICKEYTSKQALEDAVGEPYETLEKAGTVAHCKDTYVFFSDKNYHWESKKIIPWE